MAHVQSTAEVHVGDIGTKLELRIFDDDLPFDPTAATIKRIIFRLPGSIELTKTATVVPESSPIATSWLLRYQVVAGAGSGSPAGEFFAAPGPYKMQAYLEWADGSKYSSNVVTHDEDGRELRIYKNLT